MRQLEKAIGIPPVLAISSDACKGIEKAVKAIFPWAEHRVFLALDEEFCEAISGPSIWAHVSCCKDIPASIS